MNERQVPGSGKGRVNGRDWVVPNAERPGCLRDRAAIRCLRQRLIWVGSAARQRANSPPRVRTRYGSEGARSGIGGLRPERRLLLRRDAGGAGRAGQTLHHQPRGVAAAKTEGERKRNGQRA
jgi:hypothetical protein